MTPLNVLAFKLSQLSFKIYTCKAKWIEEQRVSQFSYCKIRLRHHLHDDYFIALPQLNFRKIK